MNRILRRILACVLAFAMVAGLGITTFAGDETAAENAELFEDISPYREEGNFTYPTKEGKVFGGWYADAALTETLSETTLEGSAYAKWVDENVLSVKWQITDGTTAESEKTNLRLLTTVDSLKYQLVGFHSDMYGKVEGGKEFSSNKVYKRIKSAENDEIIANDPTVFSPESIRFMTISLTNIPQRYFDQIMTVTPWWITMDGTKVYGIERQIRISEDWEETESVEFKADGECLYRLVPEQYYSNPYHVDGYTVSATNRVRIRASFVDMLFGTANAAGEFTKPITSDDAELELLLGRAEDDAVLQALEQIDYNEWIICQVDGKLVVTGWFDNATVAAARALYALAADEDDVTLELPIRGAVSADAYNTDIPRCEVGTFRGGLDGDYGTLILRYNEVTADDFETYAQVLLNSGYTLYQENEFENLSGVSTLFKTFTKDDKAVHIYFAPDAFCSMQDGNLQKYIDSSYRPEGNELRIITDFAQYMGPNEAENVYTDAGITPKLTSLNINPYYDGNAIGQCEIFTLADGSFIVFDGGVGNDNCPYTKDCDQIYNALSALNEREDGQIVVAAWLLTHAHPDHYGALQSLAKSAHAQEITIERFIYNPAGKTYLWRSEHDPYMYSWGLGNMSKWPEDLANFKNGDQTQLIHPHLGQKFYIRNATLEILFSVEEDVWPSYLDNDNATSIVSKVTLGGQSTLINGDTTLEAAYNVLLPLCNKVIGDCDIVQVAHHGLGGMTSKYYGLTNPTVAIWPTNWDTINQHDLMNASQNKGTERAKLHLVMEKYMYTLELPFDADQDAVRKQVLSEYLTNPSPVELKAAALTVGYPGGLTDAGRSYVRGKILETDADVLALTGISAADAEALAKSCGYPFCVCSGGSALFSRYTILSEQDGHAVLRTEDVETDVYYTAITGTIEPVGDNRYILLASGLSGSADAIRNTIGDPNAQVLLSEQGDVIVIAARVTEKESAYQDAETVQDSSGLTELGGLASASVKISRKSDPIVPPEPEERKITFTNWWCTTNNSTSNEQKVIAYLQEYGTDVVTLTRASSNFIGSPEAAAAFAEACGYPYFEYVLADPNGCTWASGDKALGHMILSRYPLTAEETIWLSDTKAFGHVIMEIDGEPVDIYYGFTDETAAQAAALGEAVKQIAADTGRRFIIGGDALGTITGSFESGEIDLFKGEGGSIVVSAGIAMSDKSSQNPSDYGMPYGAIDYINSATLELIKTEPEEPAAESPITFANWWCTTNNNTSNEQKVIAYLQENGTDVVTLTRASGNFIGSPEAAAAFAEACGYPYFEYVLADPNGCTWASGDKALGHMILSRYPLTAEETIWLSDTKAFGHVIMEIDGEPVDIYYGFTDETAAQAAALGEAVKQIAADTGRRFIIGGDDLSTITGSFESGAIDLFKGAGGSIAVSAGIAMSNKTSQNPSDYGMPYGAIDYINSATLEIVKTEPEEQEGPITFTNWWCTTNNSTSNEQKVIAYLQENGTDVVTLTRASSNFIGSPEAAAAFAEACGYPYFEYVLADPNGCTWASGDKALGHMILSRYPLTAEETIWLSDTKAFGHVIMEIDGEPVDIYYGFTDETAAQAAALGEIVEQNAADTGRRFIIGGDDLSAITGSFESGAIDLFKGAGGSIAVSAGIAMSNKTSQNPSDYGMPYGAIDYINSATLQIV